MELADQHALLGFCGSPWTLACYMIEGGSAEGFPRTLSWAEHETGLFNLLLEKLTMSLCDYLIMQANCGVDAIQIFDSTRYNLPSNRAWDFP